MGTSTRFYLMYGVFSEWDDAFNDTFEEYQENGGKMDDFGALDYICGTHMRIGIVLGKSADARWDAPDIDVNLDIDTLPLLKVEYILRFHKQFPEYIHLLDKPWKIMAFTYYS